MSHGRPDHPFREAPETPPPPSTDAAEALLKKHLARRRALLIGLAAGGVLVCLSPFFYIAYGIVHESMAARAAKKAQELDAREAKELAGLLARADAALVEREAAFERATSPAALATAGTGGGGRCPWSPSAPSYTAADSYVKYGSIDMNYFGSAAYEVVSPAGAAPKASHLAHVRTTIDSARASLAAKTATKRQLADVARIADGTTFATAREILLVVDRKVEPHVVGALAGDVTYDGGELSGRAYLYRHATKRIACAGEIDAENSKTVDIRYMTTVIRGTALPDDFAKRQATKAALERDLEVQIRNKLATDLEAVE
jgi:hypothetical protein